MWSKWKSRAKPKVPSVKDEYARLLQDTLTDMRPLQDVARIKTVHRAKLPARLRRISVEPRYSQTRIGL